MKPVNTFRTPEQHRAFLANLGKPAEKRKEIKALKRQKNIETSNAAVAAKATKKPKRHRQKRSREGREGRIAGYSNYPKYLSSPEWKSVRARWMASDLCHGKMCHAAGCEEVRFLEMHHRTYARIGKEELSDLILVCRECHRRIHTLQKSGLPLIEASKIVVGY